MSNLSYQFVICLILWQLNLTVFKLKQLRRESVFYINGSVVNVANFLHLSVKATYHICVKGYTPSLQTFSKMIEYCLEYIWEGGNKP